MDCFNPLIQVNDFYSWNACIIYDGKEYSFNPLIQVNDFYFTVEVIVSKNTLNVLIP